MSRAPPVAIRLGARRLSLLDVVCIGVNAIVGSGVFALPDDMQRAMGGWSPFGFVLCVLLLSPVALCFAEASSKHEDTGGPYVYVRSAFGETAGYLIGWFCWTNAFIGWAANTTLFVELAGFRSPLAAKIAAVVTVLALGAINYAGVKLGAWVVNAMVIGKIAAILLFIAAAIPAFDPSRLGGPLPLGAAGVGQGIYLALWPLQGFEQAPVTAGETDNPRRNVPLATLGSLLFSALLFTIVQALLAGGYPAIGAESPTPLVDAARFIGPSIGIAVLAGSLVSVGGFTAGSALNTPRYAQAIAAHGLLPEPMARLHPRFATPHVAILVTTFFAAVLAATFDYRRLIGMSNVTVVIQYFATCVAVPVLRRKLPSASGAWQIPGGPVVPIVGAVASLALIAGCELVEVFFAGGTLAVGLIVLWRMR